MQASNTTQLENYNVHDYNHGISEQVSDGNEDLPAAPPRVHNEYIEAEHTWYEEVAGVVSNEDDPDMLCSTFRVWFIGLFFVIWFTVVNTYFHYSTKRIILDGSHIFLLSFVLGKFLAFVFPKKSFRIWPNTNYRFSLNPGPFTIKEHVLIVTMVNLTNNSYALNPIDVQKIYYKKTIHPLLTLVFILSSQFLGHGIAGIMRRFLVWPSSVAWPVVMPSIILYRTLHDKNVDNHTDSSSKWKFSRLQFFFVALTCQFIFSWLPNYIMPILTTFAFLCFIKPHNVLLNQLTGSWTFGIGALNFKWDRLQYIITSPLIVPGWAQANLSVGFFLITWIIAPIIYYSNVWNTMNFPIRGRGIYKYDGRLYNLSAVLANNSMTNNHFRLNITAYEHYGPVYFGLSDIISYACQFVFIPALLVHTVLYHGKDILKQFRTSLQKRDNDIHCRLMARYNETPEWWFTILFILPTVISMVVCHFSDLLPWYYLLIAIPLGLVLTLPLGILCGNVGLLELSLEMVTFSFAGIILSNEPLATITFFCYIGWTFGHSANFIVVLKQSHYMKIPPRTMFSTIIVCTIVSGVVGFLTGNYLQNNMTVMCKESKYEVSSQSTCTRRAQWLFLLGSYYSVIGPARLIGHLSHYFPLVALILVGALLPIPFWLLNRRLSHRIHWLKYIHIPIMLVPGNLMMLTNGGTIPTWLFIGFICNVCISRWWYDRYARLLSIATDIGNALSESLIFFIFFNRNISFPQWWGSGVSYNSTCLKRI